MDPSEPEPTESLDELLKRYTEFNSVLSSIDDIIFTLDDQQRHTAIYGRWLQNLGMDASQFLGKRADELFPIELATPHLKANTKALGGVYTFYEWSLPTPDGLRHYQTSLSPILGESGLIIGLVGIGRDVTEFVEHRLVLEQQRRELGMLAEVLEHDLRGMLARIKNFASLAIDTSDLTMVSKIPSLVKQVDNFLSKTVALAELGQVIDYTDRKRVNLTLLIKQASDDILASNASLKLVTDIPDVKADGVKLYQVFKNIFENALRHGKANIIQISTEMEEGFVTLVIKNNGEALPDKTITELEMRDFSGLGLTITHKVVMGHGWILGAIQNPPTFLIKIPKGDVMP